MKLLNKQLFQHNHFFQKSKWRVGSLKTKKIRNDRKVYVWSLQTQSHLDVMRCAVVVGKKGEVSDFQNKPLRHFTFSGLLAKARRGLRKGSFDYVNFHHLKGKTNESVYCAKWVRIKICKRAAFYRHTNYFNSITNKTQKVFLPLAH